MSKIGIKKVPSILLAATAALVVACGGGGSGMSGTTPPGRAKPRAGGPITGFGSIYVNGVHFKTTSATIRKNRQVVAQSALKVGEIARIKGTKNDSEGNPDSVDVDENVVGPIAAINTMLNTLTVLGQTVKIDAG